MIGGPILGNSPFVRYSSARTNIVFDGNSLVAGGALADPPNQSVPGQIRALAPLNGLVTVTNIGINGQTIDDMRARGTQYADANYVPGKRNILIAWEGTNHIVNLTRTGLAAGAAMRAYCADRLAAHPDWIIVLMTTLPRFDTSAGGWSIPQANAELDAYDSYIKSNFLSMGAKKLVDVRAGGIFTYTGPSVNATMAPYMKENIHYNVAGGAVLAGYVANGLKRLRAR